MKRLALLLVILLQSCAEMKPFSFTNSNGDVIKYGENGSIEITINDEK